MPCLVGTKCHGMKRDEMSNQEDSVTQIIEHLYSIPLSTLNLIIQIQIPIP